MSFRKDKEYICKIRYCILVAVFIFIISIIYGYSITGKSHEYKVKDDKNYTSKDIIEGMKLKSPTKFERTLEVFKGNMFNSFLAIILGLGFGVISIFILIMNGISLGYIFQYYLKSGNISELTDAIMFHGIVEFPLMLISTGIGIRFGYIVFLCLKNGIKSLFKIKNDMNISLETEIKQGLYFYMKWILFGLFISSLIEVYL